MTDVKYIVEAEHICKSYVGVQALDDVSIRIKEGEIKCLAGENGCGKSTFVKIIAGVEPCTSGTIRINGKDCTKHTTKDAIDEGIQVIFQDLSLFNAMSVADNIAMNKLIKEGKPLTNKKEINKIAQDALNLIGVDIPLDAQIQELSIANRQLIAICRALALDARLLFMDEPTTALTKNEVDSLLNIVLELKKRNIAVVFISHKLDEVMRIADSITVIRDGRKIGDFAAADMDSKKIAYYMTGREVDWQQYERRDGDNNTLLEVKNLTRQGNFENVSLNVRKGDILGLTGLLGAGRTELALSIFGMNKPDSGEIFMEGKKVEIRCPEDAIDLGIGLVPEERGVQGLFLSKSVNENVAAAILKRLKGFMGNIDSNGSRKLSREAISQFRIKVYNEDTVISTLSGGNQQKALIARWAASHPKLFILDTPTVGIDIGSKAEIYEYIQKFASEGMGIILISDEVDEIVSNCNRVVVMFDGKVVKEYSEEEMQAPDIKHQINTLVESGKSN
ncbi:MAG: sugar ABC transporter ATP-binding protein [Eubacteriales bacterium]|nr:sugar ABC transporter ATP-binding protein [Eubacteriales bacterium]